MCQKTTWMRHGEQRLRDHRFAGERVHREDGVRVRVADNHRIGGIGERFERMMPLWVGSLLMAVTLKTTVSRKVRKDVERKI